MEKYHNKDIVFSFYLEIINLVFSGEINSALKKLSTQQRKTNQSYENH